MYPFLKSLSFSVIYVITTIVRTCFLLLLIWAGSAPAHNFKKKKTICLPEYPKKRLFQLTNCPLLNTTQEKLKPSPYTPKMPKQIREQLNKLIQTHNGDEAPGKTLCITTQFTQSTAAACWCRVILHWRYKWETINKLQDYIYQGGIYRRLDLWSLLLIISCVWNLGNETGCWRQGFLRAGG